MMKELTMRARISGWVIGLAASVCFAVLSTSGLAQDQLSAKEQALIKQIAEQQQQITANMAKIEAAMKVIEADLNQARIFSRRGGRGAGN